MDTADREKRYRALFGQIQKLSCDIKVMQDRGADTSSAYRILEIKQEELKTLSRERHPGNDRGTENEKGLIVVLSAPSGTGKTTICRNMLRIFPDLGFSVSYTTRPPRQGERNGRDYYFISEDEFRKRIEAGEFAEWEENYGHLYGTSFLEIKRLVDDNIDVLLDVDPRGAKSLKKKYPEGIFIFILPPSIDALEARLRGRKSEKDDMLRMRLDKAMDEMNEALWYDYVVVNEYIEETTDIVRSIYVAEKNRKKPVETLLETIMIKRR
jgi:guanylate kinase